MVQDLPDHNPDLESRYQSLFEHVPVGLYRSTPDGQIVAANPALVQMLGYPDQPTLLAVNAVDLYVDPEDRRQEQALLQQSNGACHFETRLHRYNGSVIWVRDTIWPVRDSDGKLIFNDGSLEDITERRRAEEETQYHANRLKALCEVGTDLVAELDLDTLLHSIVARAVKLLGATSGGLHLYRPEQDVLRWTTVVGPDKPAPGVTLCRGEGLAGRIWETGKPIIVDDYHCWEGRSPAFEGYAWTAVVGVPVSWGEEFLGVVDVVSEPPRRFTPGDAELLSLFANQAAIAIRNARILATADEQRRRAEAMTRATASLTSTLEPERLLENILEAAIRAIPAADRGRILLSHEEAGEPSLHVVVGYHDPHVRQAGFVCEDATTAQVMHVGRSLLIADAQTGPYRYTSRIEELLSVRSAILTPLRYRGQTIGCLALESADRKDAFTEADLLFLTTFADQAAVAVQNARLFEQVKRQHRQIRALAARLAEAEEMERQWLARELHDQIGQNLTAMGINLNIIRSQLPGSLSASAQVRLDDSISLVEQTTQRIRELMADLRPPVLDDYGLVAALRWYGEQFNARTDIPVVIYGDEPVPRLTAHVDTSLFRIAQEAFTNVARHAQASQVTVTVEADGKTVRMVIADDGIGFVPSQLAQSAKRAGWGLLTMRERAESVGGSCSIESNPQRGTRVIVEVPR